MTSFSAAVFHAIALSLFFLVFVIFRLFQKKKKWRSVWIFKAICLCWGSQGRLSIMEQNRPKVEDSFTLSLPVYHRLLSKNEESVCPEFGASKNKYEGG